MFELLDRDGRNIGEIIDTWAHVDVSFVIFVKKDEQLVPTIFFFFRWLFSPCELAPGSEIRFIIQTNNRMLRGPNERIVNDRMISLCFNVKRR